MLSSSFVKAIRLIESVSRFCQETAKSIADKEDNMKSATSWQFCYLVG